MSEIETVIGTDTKGKSKIKTTMKNMSLKIHKYSEDDEEFMETTNEFTTMVDFIQYFVDHGKEILDDIYDHTCDYDLEVSMPGNQFLHTNMGDRRHLTIYMELEADFIAKEMKNDKEALQKISEIAQKRTGWNRDSGN